MRPTRRRATRWRPTLQADPAAGKKAALPSAAASGTARARTACVRGSRRGCQSLACKRVGHRRLVRLRANGPRANRLAHAV